MPSYISTGGETLEPGIYDVEIINADEAESKNGNEMLVLTCQPVGTTKEIKFWLVFSEKTAFRLDEFQVARGLNVEKGEEYCIEIEDVMGLTLKAKLEYEKSEGKTYLRIAQWLPKDHKVTTPKPPATNSLAEIDLSGDSIPF